MKSFKDFGIKPAVQGFTGDKIKIERIINREISVHDYKIVDSKVKNGEKCLHLQIAIGTTKHVVFSGSKNLMATIVQVSQSDFPFKTTITKDNDRLEFT